MKRSVDLPQSYAQQLYLASYLIAKVASGLKKSTVRLGKGTISPGKLELIASDGEPHIYIVNVTDVYYKKWYDLSLQDALLEGYATINDLHVALRLNYADAKDDDDVTIIVFEV